MENRVEFKPSTADSSSDGDCMLGAEEIAAIEEALRKVCPFGEVRLVVERGRLRWLVVQQSLDVLKLVRQAKAD
jgi:hypothetical protein